MCWVSECNIAAVASMPLGNLGDAVFEFISWILRLYIFLKLEEGGIFADIDQSPEEDVHLASFQGGDFILFQSFKKQLTFFYCKALKNSSPFLLRRLWNRGATGKSLIQNVG